MVIFRIFAPILKTNYNGNNKKETISANRKDG